MGANIKIGNLSSSAAKYLSAIESQLGLSTVARKQIEKAASEASKPLSGADLMLALCQAVPSKAAEFTTIRDGGDVTIGRKQACFQPKVHSAKIVKYGEISPPKPADVKNPPPPPPAVWTRDPIYFDLTMPENTAAVVLLNGRTQKRMKTVARQGVDLKGLKIAERYEGDAKLDIRRVKATADRIQGKEKHEGTFDLGDPLIFVFLKKDGNEQKRIEFYPDNESRVDVYEWRDNPNYPGYQHYYTRHLKETVVSKGDALDTTPVPVEMGRLGVRFGIKGKCAQDAWFKGQIDTRDLTIGIDIAKGLVKELGADALVSFGEPEIFSQTPAKVSVGATQTDQQGSPKDELKVRLSKAKGAERMISWDRLLDQKVKVTASSRKVTQDPKDVKGDTASRTKKLADFLYADAKKFTVGNSTANPRSALRFTKDVPKSLPGHRIIAYKKAIPDSECDGQRIHLRLAKGFISTDDKAATVKGFKVAIGYEDKAGQWHPCENQTVTALRESQEMAFQFDIDDANKARDEKRNYKVMVYMPYGNTPVPLQSFEIPLNKLGWG